MKKMMFNDRYCLTQAVIEGRKTVTRRMISGFPLLPSDHIEDARVFPDGYVHIIANGGESLMEIKCHYKVGEVVAVAQRYQDIFDYSNCVNPYDWEDDDKPSGWTNKMFAKAEFMPHQIRITGIRCERLQDISDEDCLKEGVRVEFARNGMPMYYYFDIKRQREVWFDTPREVFAALIDKVSGKGTWEQNPWVFVYEFELVK